MGARIEQLVVSASPDAWREAGFTVDDDGGCHIGEVDVRIVPDAEGTGITSWALSGVELAGRTEVEAIPTEAVGRAEPTEASTSHANGATRIDHLVLITPDLTRTIDAIAAIGPEVRRVRDIGTPESPMQQAFFRFEDVILEVVGPPDRPSDGRARWFGIALEVDDLGQPAGVLGERLGRVKDAVQPGRRIATLHDAPDSLSLAVAFMDTPGARDEVGGRPAGSDRSRH